MKILAVNSLRGKNKPIRSLFKACEADFNFLVRGSDDFFVDSFAGGKKIFLGPSANGWSELFFFLFVIVAWPVYFTWLLFLKIKEKAGVLVCVNVNEKIILTLMAKMVGYKVVWLDLPEKKPSIFSPSSWLLILFSNLANIAFFSNSSIKARVKKGFLKENLYYLPPAADLQYAIQDNLFSELAVSDKPHKFFKNFSIGTVVDFSDRGHFETLLKAVKNCSNIIPNIQLVVIGASAERRNFNWLSKKMGIESRVWFVGEQGDLVKWFDSFDLYFSLSNNPNLFDLETTLLAMSRGVPAVVFQHELFRDFISDGESGFVVAPGNVDALTNQLIDIEPNKRLLKEVGLRGQSLVQERFNRKIQTEVFKSLFSN